MTDTPVKKSILRLLRDGIQWLLHIVLIPFVAVTKGFISLLTHLLTEMEKV